MTEATCETRSFDLPNPGRILDASQIQQSSNTLIIQDKLQNLNQLHAQGLISQDEFFQRRNQIMKEAARMKNQQPQQRASFMGGGPSMGSMYGGQQPQQAVMSGGGGFGGQQPQRATSSLGGGSMYGGQQPQQAVMSGGGGFGGQQPQRATSSLGGGSMYGGQQPQQAVMSGGGGFGGQQPQRATSSLGGGSMYGGQQPQQAVMSGGIGGQQPQRATSSLGGGSMYGGQQPQQAVMSGGIGGQQPQRAVVGGGGGTPSKDDPNVIQLDMLFESGFIEKAEYDARMAELSGNPASGTPPQIPDSSLSPQHQGSPQQVSPARGNPNSFLGAPSSPASPEVKDLGGVLPTKKRGPVSDNEQNRQLNMKRDQEKKVRAARKKAIVQQIQTETPPAYNDQVAAPISQDVSDGIRNTWLQLDPNNQTRNLNDIQKISEMLASGRPDVVDLALRYLTHLSTTQEFLQLLPQTTALRGVIQALGNGRGGATEGIVELACWVISNLATVEKNRPILRQAGAVRAIVPYLGVSNGQALQQVLSSCSNLLQEPINKVAFEQCGGHNHLVSLLNRAVDGDLTEKQSQIVRVLCILGFQDDDVKQAVLSGGGIRLFLRLLYSPDVEVQRFSCHALSSLAADGSQNDVIREEGGLAPLLHLLGSTDPFIREKISHLIANLTANDANMDAIREQGSIPMLVELSQCDYEPVQLPIMWAISNLLLSVENQNIFEDLGGIDILINQLASTNGKLVGRVGWAMVNLTQFSDFLRKNIGERPGAMSTILRQLMGGPEEGRGPLLRALVNLLLTYECERLFIENRGVEVILALLRAKEPQAGPPAGRELVVQPQDKELCLMALVNISKSDESRNEIKNKDGLAAILQAIYRPSTGNMQFQALRLLTNIVINGRIRYMLKTNQNVMQTLTQLCENQTVQIRRQAEMCKNNLSFPCTEFDETNYVQQSNPNALAAVEMAQKEMENDLAEELEFAAQMLEDLDIEAELGSGTADNKPKLGQQDVVYLNQQDVEEMQEMSFQIQSASEPVPQQIVIESVAMMASQAVVISQPQTMGQPQSAVIEVLHAPQPQQAVISEAPKPQQAQTSENALAYQEMIKKQQEKQRKMNELKEAALKKKMEEKEERQKQEEAEAAAQEARAQDARAQAQVLEQQGLQQQAAAKNQEAQEAEENARAKKEARRMNIAAELLVTEKTYVEGLQGMTKKYMQPMLSASTSKKPPISEDAVKKVFSNVETILTYHQMLLEGIEKRVSNWNAQSKIGDIFVDMVDRLVCYANYVNNYDLAVKMLTDIEAKSPAFHEFLQQLTAEASKMRVQNLFSLLVLPVQRLPRYEMMFSDLIRHTPAGHEDLENLKIAHKKITVVAKKIDEAKHSFDCDLQMKKIAKLLLGRPKSLLHEERTLHEFGNLSVNRGPSFFCLLFSDILTITRLTEGNIEAYEWVKDVNLQGGQLKNYRDSDTIRNAFGLTTEGETYLFNTQDGETKNKWLSRFQKVLKSSPHRLNDADLSAVETKRIKRLQRRSQRGSKAKLTIPGTN